MAKKKNKPEAVGVNSEVPGEATPEAMNALTKYEKYKIVQVNRKALTNAPYNPRQITDQAKKRLRRIIEKQGLVEPLVWNRRTGHLVGGHQRISILDMLEGTNDYSLHVAEIDVDLLREKELNVALNNQSAQGEYDFDKLEEIYKEKDIDIESTGFEVGDIYRMFGDAPMAGKVEEMKKLADAYRNFREQHEDLLDGLAKRDQNNYYLVVFPDGTAAEEFLAALSLPHERHINGSRLMEMLTPEQRKLGKAELKANCDYCDTVNAVDPGQTQVVCRMCKKEFTVEHEPEQPAEPSEAESLAE